MRKMHRHSDFKAEIHKTLTFSENRKILETVTEHVWY